MAGMCYADRRMTTETGGTRPRLTPKGQARREQIVAAAARLINERGVAATSTEDVLEAAGVSSSQLYHYFADKMSLVRAVIAFLTNLVLENQQPLLGHLDSIEALRTWRDLLLEIQRRVDYVGGCPIGTLAGELAENSPEARNDIALGFERWEDGIRSGLRAMHDRGELRSNPDELALALLAALQGGLLLTQLRRDPEPLRAALDTVIDRIETLTTRKKPRRTNAR
jgi:TetR/AcrR family transcriptional regulator, transcriptional repressor for nem operon